MNYDVKKHITAAENEIKTVQNLIKLLQLYSKDLDDQNLKKDIDTCQKELKQLALIRKKDFRSG
jgi:hypothetical protein